MSSTRLFRAFAWLLRRLAGRDSADAVLGDLLEEWHHSRSRIRFVWDAASILVSYGPARFDASRVVPRRQHHMVMDSLVLDVKFAARSIAKRPAFAIVVVTTLALGIGAATAVFSATEGILLRPLPYGEPDRLVFANETDGARRMTFAWPNYVDMRERARPLKALRVTREPASA